MPTFKNQLENLTQLKHKLAVWEAVYSLLDEQFVTKDGRSASRIIKAPDCMVERVSEDTIEDVLQTIGDGPISELKKQIAAIEDQEVITFKEAKVKA